MSSSSGGAFELRPEQRIALHAIVQRSTIVNMPTGSGKTLVAALAISHFLEYERKRDPDPTRRRRCLFVVPTRALTSQQAQYVRAHAPICQERSDGSHARVAELCGQEMEAWTQKNWDDVMASNSVLVGTPEVFRRAFVDARSIRPCQFCLIVYDECHNATGNSPMASIQNDAVLPHAANLPHADACKVSVLGLTASFVHGKMKNIEEKRKQLETLLGAHMISPAPSGPAPSGASSSLSGLPPDEARLYHRVSFVAEDVSEFKPAVLGEVAKALQHYPPKLVHPKDERAVPARAWAVFESLGSKALVFFLREGLLTQLEARAAEMATRARAALSAGKGGFLEPEIWHRRLESVAEAKRQLAAAGLKLEYKGRNPPDRTQKVKRLLELLEELRARAERKKPAFVFRGIIFVTQVGFTYPVAALVNEHYRKWNAEDPDRPVDLPVALPVSGVGSMKDRMREENLAAFKAGKVPLLVSTNALEEGIDVAECSFVIRLDKFETTKSHIQGSGRARNPNAEIYYFENCPETEKLQARRMRAVAGDARLASSDHEMAEAKARAARASSGNGCGTGVVHPFRRTESSGEINVFNCLTIFFEYCQMVMRQSVDPEKAFFEIVPASEDVDGDGLTEPPPRIERVVCPTPDGPQDCTLADVEALWRNRTVEAVVGGAGRLRNWTPWEVEKHRFVYVVAIQLALLKEGAYLGPENRPTQIALDKTRAACDPHKIREQIRLKKGYPPLCPPELVAALAAGPPRARALSDGTIPFDAKVEGWAAWSSVSSTPSRSGHASTASAAASADAHRMHTPPESPRAPAAPFMPSTAPGTAPEQVQAQAPPPPISTSKVTDENCEELVAQFCSAVGRELRERVENGRIEEVEYPTPSAENPDEVEAMQWDDVEDMGLLRDGVSMEGMNECEQRHRFLYAIANQLVSQGLMEADGRPSRQALDALRSRASRSSSPVASTVPPSVAAAAGFRSRRLAPPAAVAGPAAPSAAGPYRTAPSSPYAPSVGSASGYATPLGSRSLAPQFQGARLEAVSSPFAPSLASGYSTPPSVLGLGARAAAPPPLAFVHSGPPALAAPATAARPPPENNAKNRLQERFQARYPTAWEGVLRYDTLPDPAGGFVSTVTVSEPGRPPRQFRGEARGTKKEAEKSAAAAACRVLEFG